MKIRPVEAELYHEDTQTDKQRDMTKLIVAFRSLNLLPSVVSEISHGVSTVALLLG